MKKRKKLNHNLNILEDGQGGLLEVLYLMVTSMFHTLKTEGMEIQVLVAKAKYKKKLEFKNIFRAEPPINSGYHFGSRMIIKEKYLYVSAGERTKE